MRLGVNHYSGALLWLAPALTANITLGRKSMAVANTLAYYEMAIITALKIFKLQAPVVYVINTLRYINNLIKTVQLIPIKLPLYPFNLI